MKIYQDLLTGPLINYFVKIDCITAGKPKGVQIQLNIFQIILLKKKIREKIKDMIRKRAK